MRYITLLLMISFAGCNQQKKSSGEYITLHGTKIYFEEYGKGTPLILHQGGGINRSTKDFAACIPELAKHYRVIAFDSPGQGKSELADSLSYELLTEYTSSFIDQLKLDSTYLMGFSDGAIVGLLLAERRSDKVKKVIAVGANNGVAAVLPPGIDISAVTPYSFDDWQNRNKDVIDEYMKVLPRDFKKLFNDQNKMWYEVKYFPDSLLERINIPVMIAQGDHDDIRVEHAVGLHRLVKNSQLCIIPNTSHDVFEEQPELITKIAITFFGEPKQ